MNMDIGEGAFVASCANGDRRALNEFVEGYGRIIRAAVMRTLAVYRFGDISDNADDVVQNVFVRLLQNDCKLLKSFDAGRASLATWLSIVARSTALNFLNRQKPAAQPLDCNTLAAPPDPVRENLSFPEDLLTSRQKLVLKMLFDDERDILETADAIGIAPQSVRSAKHKAIERLRSYFRHEAEKQ